METESLPSSLIEKWESEAILQGVSVYEIGNFMKMKEKAWRESKRADVPERESLYTNASCNRLTKHGQKAVYEKLMEIPTVERIVKIARYNFAELQRKMERGFSTDTQKEIFVSEREYWFAHLKSQMKEHRISKETLLQYGLNWNDCKRFAFLTV